MSQGFWDPCLNVGTVVVRYLHDVLCAVEGVESQVYLSAAGGSDEYSYPMVT